MIPTFLQDIVNVRFNHAFSISSKKVHETPQERPNQEESQDEYCMASLTSTGKGYSQR